jgi:hypothetical protein
LAGRLSANFFTFTPLSDVIVKPLSPVILLVLLLGLVQHSFAQNQLVLLKGQKVKLRLYPGDDFVYRLKGSKKVRSSYVNNLSDTAVVAHKDIVPFHKIERLYFKQSNLMNVVGGLLVIGGAGYFLIDQFNVVVVDGDKANLDDNVTITSAAMVGAGLPMMLLRKKSQKLGGRYRLLMVTKGSPFYRPDMRRHELLDLYTN